jgi:hypothetical protein
VVSLPCVGRRVKLSTAFSSAGVCAGKRVAAASGFVKVGANEVRKEEERGAKMIVSV